MIISHQTNPVYLKPNVIIEPLFNQWYAWSYLIPPATAAFYVANSHLKILESFIAAPQVHQDALKNPAMLGAPFINYDESRLDELKALWETTKDKLAALLELEQAIKHLEKVLIEEAKGYSLEPFYQKVPEALKGYIELVYDTQNTPSIRLIEGLLYRSQYYNPAFQSVALSLGNIDQRSFVLSTPRLADENSLHLNLSFADKRLDKLVQMREKPQAYQDILDLLEIPPQNEPLFTSLFTETPPPSQPKYQGNDVRVRYFGHACILIETEDISILCDPLVSYHTLDGIYRYSYADLPPTIDYALITHNHQDHVMFETLLQLRYKIKNIIVPKSNKGVLIDPSLKLILQQIGFRNVIEIDELEVIEIPQGEIVSLPVLGEHGDLNIAAKTAYLIQVKNRSILCAADSNNIEPQLYQHLSSLIKRLDILFIGMECEGAPFTWAYGSLLTQSIPRKIAQTRRLDGSDSHKAIKLINQLNPQQVYIYAMGQEPWLTFITSIQYTPESKPILESNKVIEYCKTQNIMSQRLFGCQEMILQANSENAVNLNFSVSYPHQELQQPISEFLSKLSQLDIKIHTEGDILRCNAPKGVLTSTMKTQLKERKPEIINYLNNQNQQKITLDYLKAEATLDESIYPQNYVIVGNQPKTILLTGATGFLGSFLLNELLHKTEAKIYCLVRSEQPELTEDKLKNVLKSASLWDESFKPRIIPIRGDLSQPIFGLSSEQFQQLADEIDVIYHNGAWVHHASPYSLLKQTNVLGTQEILRLACQSKTKPVHFISSVSVFNFNEYSQVKVINEQDDLEIGEVPNGGYSQSKWVAEKLVKIAAQRGLPSSIYRIGPISGSSQTGYFNNNDFLYRLMLGYIQLGSAPEGEMLLDIIPVDYASKALVHLSQKQEFIGKAFHLIHPQPVSSNLLFEQLGLMGYPIQRIPYQQWYSKLLEIAKRSPEHPLYPLVSLFSPTSSQKAKEKSMNLKLNCQNTIKGLAETSITCPPIDANLLKTYISQLVQKVN
ncbi:thioester reductase domain-containing protein [Limnoraphis robusta Tam1]|uniref:thioester reductase domain-containing protein n=1 Tax=Limnoraphis robusta TaxID=1118279 RepID=UPI002B209946|nr:thioester reductase domain-containing protein [Limnoraphis robusta]MEA5498671.1 thioester reductase domain-containing protein [Limnoraphis robusta BA-68 BA1]MEA5539011.1 thioester reductase domain-containing protein [Limnoraphis robusta Tam1]